MNSGSTTGVCFGQLSSASATIRMVSLANLQAASRFQSRRQGSGGRRHHGFGGAAGRTAQQSGSRIHEQERQAGDELRSVAVPAPAPDDAIHRGFDKDAEADIASPGTFLSNFEPLTFEQARAMVDNVVAFDQFTEPVKRLIGDFASKPCGLCQRLPTDVGVVGKPANGE